MANRHYSNLADEIARMQNERNEAYVSASDSPSSSVQINPPPQSAGSSNPPVNQANSVINEPRIDGYDEVFDPPVTQDYECPICMMVLRNPVQTPCGHRFCSACIHRHIATNGPTCPSDNEALNADQVFTDNFAKREINQLTVKCRTVKNNKECPWTGPLQDIEEHLKTCEFVEVLCPKGCNQNVERKVLDHHLKKECSKRTVICSHCKTEVQHKNHKDHLGKCQKVTVACPNCNKKMLRERLTAGHSKECPKAQVFCDFKPYGCTWTGLRLHVQNHLTNEASMASHISMLCVAMSALFPANGRGKAGASASASGSTSGRSANGSSSGSTNGSGSVNGTILEELNRQRNRNTESIVTLEAKCEQLERKYRDLTSRSERQQTQNEASVNAVKKSLVELEARMCNGIYLWRIAGYGRHLGNARDNIVTALHSPPFYTSFYGYKLCLRINPNGVDTGYGSHVSLFVHMMQSDWDDTLEWPFSGRISLSILDQSDDGEYKRHISETLVTRPNLLAFQRPTTPRNHKGYGYVEFAHIETLQDRQYVKNDCLLVRVQVFQ